MSLRVPSYEPYGSVNPLTVLARFDPNRKQQFIATDDVARMAVTVLLAEGDWWLGKVLELAGPSQLSPCDEAKLRSELLGGVEVTCDAKAWELWNRKSEFLGLFGRSSSPWLLLAGMMRQFVSQDVAKALLPGGLQDYETWFKNEMQRITQQSLVADDEVVGGCVLQ